MATIFTRLLEGDLPGRFVWRDDQCVAFLSINPLQPGHTLVVPIAEVDHWIDLDPPLAQHLMAVAQQVGVALQRGFNPARVGLLVLGMEVPHVHLHVVPMNAESDLHFEKAARNPDPADLDRAADVIRRELRALGRAEVVG